MLRDTSDLHCLVHHKIDCLIYKLYELTEDEIAIVEEATQRAK